MKSFGVIRKDDKCILIHLTLADTYPMFRSSQLLEQTENFIEKRHELFCGGNWWICDQTNDCDMIDGGNIDFLSHSAV